MTAIRGPGAPILNLYGSMTTEVKKKYAYTLHNQIALVEGGRAYFDLLKQLITNASRSIFIRIYIWEEDITGKAIASHLIEAAQKNITVYVLADGYASRGLSRAFISNLTNVGIHFRFFEPLLRSSNFYFGRRMHEKVVVIDEDHALVGGINFADRYNEVENIPAWLDYALHVQGEAALHLYNYCAEDWKLPQRPTGINLPQKGSSVRISRNDWVKRKHEIWRTYFRWFNQSSHSITIMCSYFLPGRILRKLLSRAAKRGVKIKVILAGPSDVMLAKHAERYLYSFLLKNNIELYEYQPTILHAKMMVVDNHWVTVGSFNINDISAYASMELNLDIRNRPFAQSTQTLMDKIISEHCIRVDEKIMAQQAGFFKRLLQRSSYEFIRLVLNLSTFYFKHE